MANLAPGGIQLALQIGGGKAMLPRVEPVGIESQFLGDHFSGLTAGKPVQDRFTFERFVEFAADFDRCLVHGLHGSLFTQFSVRQYESTSMGRIQELEKEVMDLKILNKGKDYFVEQMQRERNGFFEQAISTNCKVGELEVKLLGLERPREP